MLEWTLCLGLQNADPLAGGTLQIFKGDPTDGAVSLRLVIDATAASIVVEVQRSIVGRGVRLARVTFGGTTVAGPSTSIRVGYAGGVLTLDTGGSTRTATLAQAGSPERLTDCGLGTAQCVLAVVQDPQFVGILSRAELLYGVSGCAV